MMISLNNGKYLISGPSKIKKTEVPDFLQEAPHGTVVTLLGNNAQENTARKNYK
jgi:hypothetical protein